jgi:predicted Zn-dependent protease
VDWSRRELLAGLGVGAASVLIAACGGSGGRVKRATDTRVADGELEAWLRGAVEDLRVEFASASAVAVVSRRSLAALDLRGSGVVRGQHARVIVRGEDAAGRAVERSTGELSAAAVTALVASIRRTTTPGGDVGLGAAARHGDQLADPSQRDDIAWLDQVSRLDRLAEPVATSRVVYRGAWVDTDDVVVWHVASGENVATVRRQHLVRSRGGVVLMSWSGTLPMIGQVERGAVGGPEKIVLTDGDIRAAGRGALELTTPGAVPSGEVNVLLMPSVVGRLAEVAIAPLLTTAAWARVDHAPRTLAGKTIGAEAITIRTDPDPARYGGYHFDGEGLPGTAAALVDAGVLVTPVGDRSGRAVMPNAIAGAGLRPGHGGPVEPAIGHLAWAAGARTADPEQLAEQMDDAWIVDQAGAGHVDPATWSVTIELGRAREVKRGAETGRVFAGAELSASVPALLAATAAVTSTREQFVGRSGGTRDARWWSLEVPALVSRAALGPRRPG